MKDDLTTHKLNHEKMKTFGKKILKPKLKMPMTGYGLWQKEESKQICHDNPGIIIMEVSSELGKKWITVDSATKIQLKKKATEFNENLQNKNHENKNHGA